MLDPIDAFLADYSSETPVRLALTRRTGVFSVSGYRPQIPDPEVWVAIDV